MSSQIRITAIAEKGGRLRLLARDKSFNDLEIDRLDLTRSLATTNWTLLQGVEYSFEMTSYHFSDEYALSTDNGTVWQVGSQIKYKPLVLGQGGFTINGTHHPVTVVPNKPSKPSITLPTINQIMEVMTFPVTTSPYEDVSEEMTHTATRWQVSADPAFTTIALEWTVTSGDLTMSSIENSLTRGAAYYIRVKHIGTKPD